MSKPQNFIVNQRKLQDAVLALEDFMNNLSNEDGTPTILPSYLNRNYYMELVASIATNLRALGERMAKFEGKELETHTFVSEEGSPFRRKN